jgi:hypothetical protein
MPKFRKKPVEVEAEQFFVGKKPWPKGVYASETPQWKGTPCLGGCFVNDGDWIVRDEEGIDIVKPAIFEQEYEVVDDDEDNVKPIPVLREQKYEEVEVE